MRSLERSARGPGYCSRTLEAYRAVHVLYGLRHLEPEAATVSTAVRSEQETASDS